MYSQVKPFLLYAVSSVHAGSGSEVGIVDLPIQREQHTRFPKIESSSLKGAIRACCLQHIRESKGEENANRYISYVFGSDPEEMKGAKQEQIKVSAVAFADARILLFPVKSMRGVFAWVTCPFVIRRFNNELAAFSANRFPSLPVPEPNSVSGERLIVGDHSVVLEEYTIPVTREQTTAELGQALNNLLLPAGIDDLHQRLVVLDDDTFVDFVLLSTEVTARISINPKTGTTSTGSLRYEEHVPPEAVFYSFLFAGNVRSSDTSQLGLSSAEDVLAFLCDDAHFPPVFQLGGNSTLGHGILRRIWLDEESDR